MKKLALANLPTKIQRLSRWSDECGKNIYVKRDDQTGSEWSGNKIRKLEFAVQEALEQGCNLLITCGGIQSNHCRATVAVAAHLGLKAAVLLRISEEPPVEGNYFLDLLMGADVRFCTRDEYRDHRGDIMQEMADGYAAQGYKPYIIPEGASFGVGVLGYYFAMKEIVAQEKEMGVRFDTVLVATGSGGTLAGLQLANLIHGCGKRVIGVCVCDDAAYFQDIAARISRDALPYLVAQGEISEQEAARWAASLKPGDFEFSAIIGQLLPVIILTISYVGTGTTLEWAGRQLWDVNVVNFLRSQKAFHADHAKIANNHAALWEMIENLQKYRENYTSLDKQYEKHKDNIRKNEKSTMARIVSKVIANNPSIDPVDANRVMEDVLAERDHENEKLHQA